MWATEFVDHSATVALAAIAQHTSSIAIGSAIAYAFGRTPLVLAAEARDLVSRAGNSLHNCNRWASAVFRGESCWWVG